MSDFQAPICVGPEDSPDKYRLIRQVGHGGEAQLWYAELDVAGGAEPVAVKILRPDRMGEFDQVRARWAEQAELLRFITHPGVVAVREHFEGLPMHRAGERPDSGRALYLVMNWVDGENLRDWAPLHLDTAGALAGLAYMSQVATVLDWLHSGAATPSSRPVIHGDVSPANILLTPAGQAVLVDFGLVRMAAHQTTQPYLSPGYAAPEVWRGEYSAAADRYAFAAVSFYLLTGAEPPTQRDELRAGLAAVPLIATLGSEVLDPLMEMFDADPDKRPLAVDWIRLLRAASATSAAATIRTAAAAAIPALELPTKRRSKLLWIAAAVTVLLAAGGGAYAVANSGAHTPQPAAVNKPTIPSASPTPTPSPSPSAVISPPPSTPPSSPPGSFGASPSVSASVSTSPSASPTASVSPSSPVLFQSPVANGPAYLADYDPTEHDNSGGSYNTDPAHSNGVIYGHPIQMYSDGLNNSDGGTYWVDYNLGKLWKTMTTTVGLRDDAAADASDTFKVLLNGNVIASGSLRLGTATPLHLDVTNGLRLRLLITTSYQGNGESNLNTVVFGDPELS